MLFDIYFHLIWCYFFVIIYVIDGLNEDIYFFYMFYFALTFSLNWTI
jgi:hypothetical protein